MIDGMEILRSLIKILAQYEKVAEAQAELHKLKLSAGGNPKREALSALRLLDRQFYRSRLEEVFAPEDLELIQRVRLRLEKEKQPRKRRLCMRWLKALKARKRPVKIAPEGKKERI
jgi:hypothetical protein